MLLDCIAILLGFVGLVWSADQFVAGAAAIAKQRGMPPIMIGLTIVSLGTSAPEIIVAINASFENASSLAVGNAIGSNLANIGMVLGITALVAPIPIGTLQLKRETPMLLLATLGAAAFLFDHHLGRIDGVILLTTLVLFFYGLIQSKAHQPDAEHEADVEHIPDVPSSKAWRLFFIGLVVMIASSKILVGGAINIALELGVSELIVGLTVIAVGTSLPELAATITSALKGHHDIALGNILGSNLFNLLGVMAVPALIAPTVLEPAVFTRDYAAMVAITLLLAALLYSRYFYARQRAKKDKIVSVRIGRFAGTLLLSAYATYYYFLFPMS